MASDDWLDISDGEKAGLPAVVSIPTEFESRVALVEGCWSSLTFKQRVFLTALRENGFNARKTARKLMPDGPRRETHVKWMHDKNYATVARIWRACAASDAVDRDRLLVRQDDIVDTLMTPKPILHEGKPTGFYETEAGAASRANEVLMKAAGILKDKDIEVNVGLVGPALNIQVVNPGGDVVDVAPRGVSVVLPEPEVVDAERTEV